MRITSKGQVTIPQDIRERYGLLPHTEVEFVESRRATVFLRKARAATGRRAMGTPGIEARRTSGMTTDEIMAPHARRGLMRERVLVDSNVLLDVLEPRTPHGHEWSDDALIVRARRTAGSSSITSCSLRCRWASPASTTLDLQLSSQPVSSARRCRGRLRSSPARRSCSIGRAGGITTLAAPRLLHRRPRGGHRHVAAHPRRRALPHLLPYRGADRAGRLTATARGTRRAGPAHHLRGGAQVREEGLPSGSACGSRRGAQSGCHQECDGRGR